MRIYIIRHADPDYINDTITPDGHLEAASLAVRLAKHGIDRIYCSPLGRAIHTMQYTVNALKCDYSIENWTCELAGLWYEESPWGPMAAWDIPGEAVRCGDICVSQENWHEQSFLCKTESRETFSELKMNSDDFLMRHGYKREGGKYRCICPNKDKIAVFCHCGFSLTWLAHLLEIPLSIMWTGFWLPPSSVTTVLFEERSDEWAVPRCLGVGDISHLYKAELPVKPSGIKKNYF